jgi:uncharacterized membrane protein YciS (DUF1049 family)
MDYLRGFIISGAGLLGLVADGKGRFSTLMLLLVIVGFVINLVCVFRGFNSVQKGR